MDTFLYAFHAVMPLLLTMALGYAVRRVGPWEDGFYKQLNRLCFYVFLPVQLFMGVYGVEQLSALNWRGAFYAVCGVFLAAAVGMACAALFIPAREQKGVLVQCSFRSSFNILGLALARQLGGDEAMGFAALVSALMVPLLNILAIVCLTRFGKDPGRKVTLRETARRIFTNPLIIGVGAALVVVGLRQLLPVVDGVPVFTIQRNLPSLYKLLGDLSKVSSPVMIFVLGTQLDFSETKHLLRQLTLGVSLRLLVCPALVLGLACALRGPLHLTAVEFPALLAASATPFSSASPVMVQELGGDVQLTNQLVAWSSALSMLTLFLLTCALRVLGVM